MTQNEAPPARRAARHAIERAAWQTDLGSLAPEGRADPTKRAQLAPLWKSVSLTNNSHQLLDLIADTNELLGKEPLHALVPRSGFTYQAFARHCLRYALGITIHYGPCRAAKNAVKLALIAISRIPMAGTEDNAPCLPPGENPGHDGPVAAR